MRLDALGAGLGLELRIGGGAARDDADVGDVALVARAPIGEIVEAAHRLLVRHVSSPPTSGGPDARPSALARDEQERRYTAPHCDGGGHDERHCYRPFLLIPRER